MRPTSARHTWARTCVAGQVDGDLDAGVGEAERLGVELGDALLLPAVGVEALAEVALGVEQPDADERHAEVGRRLQVVAGQHAEAAGVLRQGLGDAELGGEVGHRAQRRAGPRWRTSVVPLSAVCRRRLTAPMSSLTPLSPASSASRSADVVRSISAGWACPGRQPGHSRAKKRVASGSQLQWRLVASWGSAASASGMAGSDLEAADRSHRRLNVRPPTRSVVWNRPDRAVVKRQNGSTGAARRRSPWPRRWRPTSSGRPAGRRRCDACPSASAASVSTTSMHRASSSALPGSKSSPAPVPSISSASPPVRATTSGRPAGQRLQGDDAERLVERGDGHAPCPVDHVAQAVVGEEAGQVDEVADALEVDLRLQLGQVAAAPADDALDARHPRAQQAHRPGQHLEPLLVLHPAPREHERRPAAGELARRPPRRVDAVGDQVGAFGRELEPVDDLADHELGVGQHLGGVVGQPRLDGVDRARLAGRDAAAVAPALGRVERGDEAGAEQRRQRVGGPGDLPVVAVHDVGGPAALEAGDELDQVVVGGGDAGDEVVVGQPRQVGARPQHAHAVDRAVGRCAGVRQREQDDVVAGPGERLAQPVDVGGDAAHRAGWELPRQHQDPHPGHHNVAPRARRQGLS